MDMITLHLKDIQLDTANPRHDIITDQPDIINYLENEEGIERLAKDIAINGTSPLDIIGVIKSGKNKYTVVEGNRRISALTLLLNPKLSRTNSTFYSKLRDNSEHDLNKVQCCLFKSREDANLWILRRHSGPQNGVGLKQWNPEQKTRHNQKSGQTDANTLSLALLNYASDHFKNFDTNNTQLHLTTITRFLGNPNFRDLLGICSKTRESKVLINIPYNEFDVILKKFLNDLTQNNSSINSRSKKVDIENYIKSLIKKDIDPKIKLSIPIRLSDRDERQQNYTPKFDFENNANTPSTENEDSNSINENQYIDNPHSEAGPGVDFCHPEHLTDETTTPNPPTNLTTKPEELVSQPSINNPDIRKYIFPHTFKPSINNKTIKRIFNEINSIEVDNLPLSAAMLTRVFLENIYRVYYGNIHGTGNINDSKDMNKLLSNIHTHIKSKSSELSKPQRAALSYLNKTISNEHNPMSFKSFGAYAHGGHYPISIELKRSWDNLEAIILFIISDIKTWP